MVRRSIKLSCKPSVESRHMYTILHPPRPVREFHDRIYAGQILRLDAVAQQMRLVTFTQQFLEDRFHPHVPVEIHRHLSHEQQVAQFAAATRDYAGSGEVKKLLREMIAAVSMEPA